MRVRELKLLKEGIYKLYIRTRIHFNRFNVSKRMFYPLQNNL